MQTELDGEVHPLPIDILGVNAIGLEVGNPSITMNRTLPWLQDVVAVDVWTSWGVTWRDVWILDVENRPVAIYNLTVHNLADPVQYAELKALLVAASEGSL